MPDTDPKTHSSQAPMPYVTFIWCACASSGKLFCQIKSLVYHIAKLPYLPKVFWKAHVTSVVPEQMSEYMAADQDLHLCDIYLALFRHIKDIKMDLLTVFDLITAPCI